MYWAGMAVSLILGAVLPGMVPVRSGGLFLLGFFWIWNGLTTVLRCNPFFGGKYDRKREVILALTTVLMGAGWIGIAFLDRSRQMIPMLLVTAPFLAVILGTARKR